VKGARADIANVQATLSDHGELLKKMATKEDLAAQNARFDQIETDQKQQHGMLRQILRLLGQNPDE